MGHRLSSGCSPLDICQRWLPLPLCCQDCFALSLGLTNTSGQRQWIWSMLTIIKSYGGKKKKRKKRAQGKRTHKISLNYTSPWQRALLYIRKGLSIPGPNLFTPACKAAKHQYLLCQVSHSEELIFDTLRCTCTFKGKRCYSMTRQRCAAFVHWTGTWRQTFQNFNAPSMARLLETPNVNRVPCSNVPSSFRGAQGYSQSPKQKWWLHYLTHQ